MTAEPTGWVRWTPDPKKLRHATYTIEDILSLPDDAPRIELSDGVMMVLPAPTYDHQDISGLLWLWLRQHAPRKFRASHATGILVSLNTTFEPDVLLVDGGVTGTNHFAAPDQVTLVVEVVSRGTENRDRLGKWANYAVEGIPHYWRVEQNPVHIFAYDLVDGEYQPVADSDELLILRRPFDIELPIRDIIP